MGETMNFGEGDAVLDALGLLREALRASAEVDARIEERIDHIQEQRNRGLLYADIVPAEPRPLIVEMLTENLDRLATAGNRLRRVEAQALYDNGLTMDEIAVLFGVTRQRIGTLLRPRQD
jgi:hypothetical protein